MNPSPLKEFHTRTLEAKKYLGLISAANAIRGEGIIRQRMAMVLDLRSTVKFEVQSYSATGRILAWEFLIRSEDTCENNRFSVSEKLAKTK